MREIFEAGAALLQIEASHRRHPMAGGQRLDRLIAGSDSGPDRRRCALARAIGSSWQFTP